MTPARCLSVLLSAGLLLLAGHAAFGHITPDADFHAHARLSLTGSGTDTGQTHQVEWDPDECPYCPTARTFTVPRDSVGIINPARSYCSHVCTTTPGLERVRSPAQPRAPPAHSHT